MVESVRVVVGEVVPVWVEVPELDWAEVGRAEGKIARLDTSTATPVNKRVLEGFINKFLL